MKKKTVYSERIKKLLKYFSVVDLAHTFTVSVTAVYGWRAGKFQPQLVHKKAIDALLQSAQNRVESR